MIPGRQQNDKREYEHLVAILDQLIDQIGGEERHPLASLMEVTGVFIEKAHLFWT